MNPHPGFHKAAQAIAAQHNIPLKNARAILASSTRRASPAAKRSNPDLKRVK